ncbi:MAG TPA: substrate-binding domain-containing protein [Acidimicrobiales bacterium]|nr:substrate-binding domain-containing protein [Acidimicrobiales bacterium]
MKSGKKLRFISVLGTAAALGVSVLVVGGANVATAGAAHAKYKIALSLSYTGNDWQSEAANLVKAEAATAPYKSLVSLHTDIAGADVTNQIKTLQNEISAGYKAIIVYPISPTALNATIAQACKAGIAVFAYDSLVTAPCAYNIHIDQYAWGIYVASWLAKAMNGKGTIADITGVPGTTVDTDRQKALSNILAKNPGITIAGSANGAWAQAQGLTAFESIFTAHPDITGIYAEAGCGTIEEYLASIKHALLPCGGEFENNTHLDMLSTALGGLGVQSASAGSPVYSGELALIDAVKVLQGKKIAHDTILPLPHFNSADLAKLGAKAVGTNPAAGAVVFPAKKVVPGMFGDFWSPLVEQGLQANLHGTSNKVSSAKPCAKVRGCKSAAHLKFDSNHSGGN